MTFKWGKLYHRSLQFFLSSGLGGGCDENGNNDALIDGKKQQVMRLVLAICIEKRKIGKILILYSWGSCYANPWSI